MFHYIDIVSRGENGFSSAPFDNYDAICMTLSTRFLRWPIPCTELHFDIILFSEKVIASFDPFLNNFFYTPYARHYNPRFVYFLTHFYIEVRFILQTTYGLKTEILHFLSLKSEVYIQERLLIKSGL